MNLQFFGGRGSESGKGGASASPVTQYVNSFKGLDWDGALRHSLISSNRMNTRNLVSALNANGVNFMTLQELANGNISKSSLESVKMNVSARISGLRNVLREQTDTNSSYYKSLTNEYETLIQFSNYLSRQK